MFSIFSMFSRISHATTREIAKIERQQQVTNRRISQLQKQLETCRTSMEVKVMRDSIMDEVRWKLKNNKAGN